MYDDITAAFSLLCPVFQYVLLQCLAALTICLLQCQSWFTVAQNIASPGHTQLHTRVFHSFEVPTEPWVLVETRAVSRVRVSAQEMSEKTDRISGIRNRFATDPDATDAKSNSWCVLFYPTE